MCLRIAKRVQRYDSGEMRFQFLFSLLMQFPFISVYCLFFFACKGTIRRKGGLGNSGGSNYMCPNYISGNGRNRGSFLYGRLRGAMSEYYSDVINEEKSGSQPLQQTKGLRIKFAGNKRKKAIKEKDRRL